MNTYLVPVADYKAFDTWIVKILAHSFSDCEDKLMDYMCEHHPDIPNNIHYTDFIYECDKRDICIGEIKDIEEL